MTILRVIQQVCPVIGLAVPSAVLSSTLREHVELSALANEMAQRIAFDTHDWTKLKALAVLTGDGARSSFPLPSDYRRMLKKARLWPSATPNAPLYHYPDTDEWLGLQTQTAGWVGGGWTLIGDEILVRPAVPTAATLRFYYITQNIVKDATGAAKAEFTADTDVFRLDERVLKLAMIWQWRANKGLAYAEDLATYNEAVNSAAGSDKGSSTITMGRRGAFPGIGIAYPGTLGP